MLLFFHMLWYLTYIYQCWVFFTGTPCTFLHILITLKPSSKTIAIKTKLNNTKIIVFLIQILTFFFILFIFLFFLIIKIMSAFFNSFLAKFSNWSSTFHQNSIHKLNSWLGCHENKSCLGEHQVEVILCKSSQQRIK